MQTLIAILTYLAASGLSLNDFDIQTRYSTYDKNSVAYYDEHTDRVYDCDGWPTTDATILICAKDRLIIINKDAP